MKESILDHWQEAKDFVASQGYDLLRFVKYENGCEITYRIESQIISLLFGGLNNYLYICK